MDSPWTEKERRVARVVGAVVVGAFVLLVVGIPCLVKLIEIGYGQIEEHPSPTPWTEHVLIAALVAIPHICGGLAGWLFWRALVKLGDDAPDPPHAPGR